MQFLKTLAIVVILSALVSGCASVGVGGSTSGNEFNYQACEKLRKGQSMDSVKQSLGAEPVTTGKLPGKGWLHWHYEYSKSKRTGLGLGGLVPGAASGSKSNVTQFNCDVYFSNNKVVEFTYNKLNKGSQGGGAGI